MTSLDFIISPDEKPQHDSGGGGGSGCFVTGTSITTPDGSVCVEDLSIGAMVLTAAGIKPIRWIGYLSHDAESIVDDREVLPVRIRRGALGENLPERDLWVSPGHAMFVDGVLVPAILLVNGVSIFQEERVDELKYFHLEFESHTIIYAESAPTESFVQEESRATFDNAAEFDRLYPDASPVFAGLCAPRVEGGEALQRIQRRLAERASGVKISQDSTPWHGRLDVARRDRIEGWAEDLTYPTRPLRMRITDNGLPIALVTASEYRADLQEAGIGEGCCAFSFEVPGGLDPGITHIIEVQRADDGRLLEGSPIAVGPSAFTIAARSPSAPALTT